MITGLLHPGSGLGNMLFRYITTRTLALDKGYEFSMVNSEAFKGKSFMNLDFGSSVDHDFKIEYPAGKVVVNGVHPLWEEKGFYYNPEINYLADNTIIDGSFEDSRYWEHRMGEIDEWLKVEPLDVSDDTCVIGFRGGEYQAVPELFLPESYWHEAIEMMDKKGIKNFEIHTDDPVAAHSMFGPIPIIHDIGINWRAMRYAKHAIIANSSFYVLPRLLNGGITISPKYWNRYNTKKWDYPQNYYKQFIHI